MAKQKNIAIALRLDEPYPHHQRVFEGIQRYATERGDWNCLIDEHPGYRLEKRGPRYPSYDGVIARADEVMQERLKKIGLPFVNTHYQYKRPGVPGVYIDPQGIGTLAAEHLIRRGFKRLCVLVDHRHAHAYATKLSFERFAEEEEIKECTTLDMGEKTYELAEYWIGLEQQISDLLSQLEPPAGVFVETAPHARLLIQQCLAQGLRVPEDIAVLCQHNLRAIVDVSPRISCVNVNYEIVGYQAAEMLDQLMAGKALKNEHLHLPPVGVIGQESTDYFAVQDAVVAEALQLISSRLTQKLRVDDIAYELAISPSQLKNRFAASLGRGVAEEIRRLRLESAKRMLADGEQQISQIAKACGFTTADTMTQVFRRELGLTPTEYRKKVLGEAPSREAG